MTGLEGTCRVLFEDLADPVRGANLWLFAAPPLSPASEGFLLPRGPCASGCISSPGLLLTFRSGLSSGATEPVFLCGER